ncbi:MAG TPA: DNA polymerase III subunit gamma/tau [Acidimicrobiia bacterium]|nr:DNA polymerase III subunit gamma/tau [Acidimicrobiia bacterium]
MMETPSLPHTGFMGQFSLYRRYRPQTFAEVVGQNHVTQTLQNALAEERVPHACLFSGPRGTGKTSTARILAKALNCERAPSREPCNVCASCLEITDGSSLDVVEIDAASHGSVDDARDLREKVAYAPVGGRRKVYIIDECHMLTAAANNALLKVLEEPPSHVVFVFATTEPSKVLQTVQDRCQRYEFRTVEPEAVAQRIRQVCEAEGVAIDDAAAALLAARSSGSVRDALGLLDQAVMYSGSSVGAEDVARLFGAVADEILFEAVDLVSERDVGACFAFTDRLIRSGQEPREFLRALVDHLRSLFLIQHATAAQEILDVADDRLDRLRGQANRFGPGELLRILDLAGEAHIQLRQAVDNRLSLEIAFARMARRAGDGEEAQDLGPGHAASRGARRVRRRGAGPRVRTQEPLPPRQGLRPPLRLPDPARRGALRDVRRTSGGALRSRSE